MNITTILKKLSAYKGSVYGERAYAEMLFLSSISQNEQNKYDAMLLDAGEKLLARCQREGSLTAGALEDLEESLKSLEKEAKKYTVHAVGHAHIDMNWTWGYHETVATTLETFRTVLRLMDEYPEFVFAQSQVSTYQIVEKYEPEMLEEIGRRIREGRWEVIASTWVEGDKNLSSGEAQNRQILYAKRYLQKTFGIPFEQMNLDFEPDTFGHHIFEPEVLLSAGVTRLYHCRGCERRGMYRWRAPSGKELFVYQEPKWYLAEVTADTVADLPRTVCGAIAKEQRDFLFVYGVGDHGGGPTRRDLERLQKMNEWRLFPEIRFDTYRNFLDKMEQYIDRFPVYEGEANFIFDGCYTTQSRLKMANRLSENRLGEAEVLEALSGKGEEKPSVLLEESWHNALFGQFHDILPGSCVVESREWSMGRFQDTLAAANTVANRALRRLTDQINTESLPFDETLPGISEGAGVGSGTDRRSFFTFSVTERGRGKTRVWQIFNTTAYERTECVELKVWDYPGDLNNTVLRDEEGREYAFDILERQIGFWHLHTYAKICAQVTVPPFGYSTLIFSEREEYPEQRTGYYKDAGGCVMKDMGDFPYVLENDRISCTFDSLTLMLISVKEKDTGRELIDSPTGYFRFVREDARKGMTAWVLGKEISSENLNETRTVKVTSYLRRANRAELNYTLSFERSTLRVSVKLDKGSRQLEYLLECDWMEAGERGEGIPALIFVLEPGYAVQSYRYQAGSGSIVRSELPHDVPSIGSMELLPEGADSFLQVFSNCKYGFRGWKNRGELRLLNSGFDPDPFPELGRHYIDLMVGVCADKEEGERQRTAHAHPLIAFSACRHGGTLPLKGSLFHYNGRSTVTALKSGEEGGIVLRLFNDSAEPDSVSITPLEEKVFVADTNETPKEELPVRNGLVETVVEPYAYLTLLFR